MGLRRRRSVRAVPSLHHHARVGDAPAPAVPAGFAPVFPGWNVWDVWQADDPTFSIMNVGLDLERQLRIWVENEIAENATGAAVADPANPAALRGDQVQPIPEVSGLAAAATRANIPALAGAATLGSKDSKATLRTVRFWNRGASTIMPWPHDDNYLLDTVYTPSSDNAVTNAPQPSSLAGGASAAADAAASVVKVIAIGAGVVLAGVLVVALVNSSRKAAA